MDYWGDHIAMLIGIITFICGAISYYGAAVKKQYASERDFQHLKRSYDGLSSNITTLDKMIDARLDRSDLNQVEIRAMLLSILSRLGKHNDQG